MGRLGVYVGALIEAVRAVALGQALYIAGYMAYSALFALFPFLIFLVALAGFLGSQEQAQHLVDLMFQYLPERVAAALAPPVKDVLTNQRGGLLTFGILATIWASAGGVNALRYGLNDAYGMEDRRNVVFRYLQSILFVVLGAVSILVLSVAIVLGPVIWAAIVRWLPVDPRIEVLWNLVRYAIAIAVTTGALIVLHRYLPARRQAIRDIAPGALFTVVLWLAAASGFSLYLANVADFNVTYSGLGGAALTLFFFYLTGALFIFGAEFNAALREVSARSAGAPASTEAAHDPLAHHADG